MGEVCLCASSISSNSSSNSGSEQEKGREQTNERAYTDQITCSWDGRHIVCENVFLSLSLSPNIYAMPEDYKKLCCVIIGLRFHCHDYYDYCYDQSVESLLCFRHKKTKLSRTIPSTMAPYCLLFSPIQSSIVAVCVRVCMCVWTGTLWWCSFWRLASLRV